jgi:putative membrane protein
MESRTASVLYLIAMSEAVLLKAEFNPSIRHYYFASVSLILLVCVVTIPLLLLWALGWGQWVCRKRYESLRCELTARHLRFAKGHFFKTEKTIPLENIQDLTFIDNPILRWFDLRILKVETAGNSSASGADMQLVGIVDAASFKEQVMEARDRFVEARAQGRPAPGGVAADGDVVGLLRDIHASIEGLREELRNR